MLSFPAVLGVPFARADAASRGASAPWARCSTDCIKDPLLRAVLSAQSGNHGLAALARLAAAPRQHDRALLRRRAIYPRGGAKRIPLALIKALRRRGGAHPPAGARAPDPRRSGAARSGVELASGGERLRAGSHRLATPTPR